MAKLVKCAVCGNEMSSGAKTCPQCGHRRRGVFGRIVKWSFIGFVGLAVLGALLPTPDEEGTAGQQIATAATGGGASTGEAPASAPPDPRPADQRSFLAAVAAAQEAEKSASNDMQRGAALAVRSSAICEVLPAGKRVSGWLGEVSDISANSDGKGVFEVDLGQGVKVATWNNILSDIVHDTLIEPGTALFSTVSGLSEGQQVVFSGEFFSDQETCAAMQSMMLTTKLSRPVFVFRFSKVEPF